MIFIVSNIQSCKTIELPPYAPTLVNSTRAIGYSIESAIADIIDNSIAAEAKNVSVCFLPKEAYVAILDDGLGMDSDTLLKAMQYGSKNPTEVRDENDLGRFGLGLKTASLSQCRILTVVSKQNDKINAYRWDISFIEKNGTWLLQVLSADIIETLPEIERLKIQDSGTLVIWNDLDRLRKGAIDFDKTLAKKMASVKDHLSLVYNRYIEGEKGIQKLTIYFNNDPLEAHNPFLPQKSVLPMEDEILSFPEYGKNSIIRVRPYILPHSSSLTKDEIDSLGGTEGLRKLQGFYVYRNKRLLVWGTWFRIIRKGEFSKLARIQVDLPNTLDELWTLDIKKSSAQPPEKVKNSLENIVRKISENSKRTWTYRGKRETRDGICHIWNRLTTRGGSALYEINSEHPLLKEIYDKEPSVKRDILTFLKLVQNELPINSLYQDLTNDSKIENENEIPLEEVKKIAIAILERCGKEVKDKRFSDLLLSEPFDSYKEELEEAYHNGEL